jgi:hypothetical protein
MHPKEIVTLEDDKEEEMKKLEQNYKLKKLFFFILQRTIRK